MVTSSWINHRTKRAIAGIALVVAVAATAVSPAGATPEPVAAPLTGTLATKASEFPLAGAIFQGTFDSETGDLVGKLLFPAIDVSVTSPIEATIGLQVQQPNPGTGTVDLTTNEATFSADLVLALLTLDALGSGRLNLAPCRYAMPVELTGTYDPETGIMTLSQGAFSSSAIADPNRCFWDGIGASVAASIDPEIISDVNSLSFSFNVGDASAVPPAPPAPPAEPTEPTEPPAAPALPRESAPTYTG